METVPETTVETTSPVLEEEPEVLEEEPLLLEEPAEAAVPAEGDGETVVTIYANETLDLAERWPGCTYKIISGTQYATLDGSILTPVEGLQIPEDPGYVEVLVDADNGEESVPILVRIYPALPLMILEGMEPGEDMPQKRLRVGDTFQLKAKLTEGSAVNEGIEWFRDTNEKYDDCPPFFVAKDGTVTFNEAFEFDEDDAVGGAWNMVVARQVVEEGEEKTVADTPAVIAMFPALESLKMCIGDDMFEDTGTINAVNGFKPVSITALPDDFGPFGGVTLTLNDSNKVLKSAKKTTQKIEDWNCESEVYTVTPKKTGSFTITATAKDNPELTLTTTVTVVNETQEINIKVPASARIIEEERVKVVVMTAGQKLALSTDIPKTATDKAVTWEIFDGVYVDGYSLDGVEMPDGATASGEDWSAIASIDSKGVLRTNAGVTMDSCVILVRAALTSSFDGEGNPKVFDVLPVLIQPPVEAFEVWVDSYTEDTTSASENISPEGSVNRKDNEPWGRNINNGSFEIYAYDFQPNVIYPEVKWDIKVSNKVADWYETDYNTIVVTPKAPGKLTFTATSADGSGAKYSGIVNIYGYVDHVRISTPEDFDSNEPLHPGDTLKLSATAYYDEDEQYPISGGKYSWYVFDRYGAGDDFATIDKNGKLTITNKVTRPATLHVECDYETKINGYIVGDYAPLPIKVEPSSERTLALAAKYSEPGYTGYDIIHTAFPWHAAPDVKVEIVPVWVGKDGKVIEEVTRENVNYKVSGSACSFDKNTGILTFKKVGTTKITATATLDGKTQSFTCTFRGVYFTDKIQIQNKPDNGVITVVGGKSLSLKAINYSGTKKATEQKIYWKINKDVNVDDYCWIKPDTGKLTTYPVTKDYYVTVTAQPADLYPDDKRPTDTVTIHIVPEKTQFRSRAFAFHNEDSEIVEFSNFSLTAENNILPIKDIGYTVTNYGRYENAKITDITSSNTKIATVEKGENGNVTGIQFKKGVKPGKVTFTVKGQVQIGEDEWIDAPSAKFTITTVKPVTSIELSRPTNKDGSFVPAYVGKSLKLTAKVNSDATNKKLDWYVARYEGDPEGEFESDKVYSLYWNDKTTVKNGVLKIDKSWYSEGRCYAVWAASQDGYYVSDPILIQAYGMTGSILIDSKGDWLEENNDRDYADYLNNRTVTIKQGEALKFGALVSDVTGRWGANPDVTWTISGKNIVEKVAEGVIDNEVDELHLKGLNPGTVTIKATAKDGSKKTATFKIEVVAPAET